MPGRTIASNWCATNRCSSRPRSTRSRSTWCWAALLAARGGVLLPGESPRDGDLRPGHPHVDHLGLRRDELHGLHAQHDHAVGADAFGGHRDRRRDRGDGEYLPLHRREGLQALSRRPSRPPRKSAWRCFRSRSRWWPCSCRSRSWAASSAVLKCFGITMAATVVVSMIVSFTLTPMISAPDGSRRPATSEARQARKHGKTEEAAGWRSTGGSRAAIGFCSVSRWATAGLSCWRCSLRWDRCRCCI